ncbi:MAG TPA: glycosyltransferase family 2 protein [Rhodobacteraceae bacterium]|nr:glycosyltransferase family 2 protein [Paracoccaceae bacterium]
MRIILHIGVEQTGADRLQRLLADRRADLAAQGVLYPKSPGNRNHTRLYMAATDPDHIDPLRFNRGHIAPEKQAALRDEVMAGLAAEVAEARPDLLILSAAQLCTLWRVSELERLRGMLAPLSDDIRVLAHVDGQARVLARHYATQVMEGRGSTLERELALAQAPDWWDACLAGMPAPDPAAGQFEETQAPPFWLDYTRLVAHWEGVFGTGSVTLCPHDEATFAGPQVMDALRAAFDLSGPLPEAVPGTAPAQPSAAWLARGRQFNALVLHLLSRHEKILPRQLWRSFLSEMEIGGVPIAPGALSPIADRFAEDNRALVKAHPALTAATFRKDRKRKLWAEADPERGFRASQYLLAFMFRIDKATRAERKAKKADLAALAAQPAPAAAAPVNGEASPDTRPAPTPTPEAPRKIEVARPAKAKAPDRQQVLSETGRALLPPLAVEKFEDLRTSPFAPHNRLGAVNEEELAAAYTPAPPRDLPEGNSGNVIVGCMKNEAPYILEWVAYHRAIGVDNFLIYTNGCEDGTSEILDRLQELGVLQHRNNDDWKGNSPQQYALNQSLKEPVIRNAEWIIHIDVDEFMNVRCGNGTLPDFFERVPDATNVAMTWRLFGHNGVTRLEDRLVIDQFETCAPKFCPKPHTAWGFKTMFRNIGAYEKISCHRPNKLSEAFRDKVKWVNGSGRDMTKEAADNGWRNSKKSIGYDLLQLNHYALRSAESFLIKRQRGRALHVDRSIGLNYWIRMDWSDYRDITIKRNLPRVRAEYDRLLADARLGALHQGGLDWHRAKARELHAIPEFEELYQQALKVKLTETERAAYALALDLES